MKTGKRHRARGQPRNESHMLNCEMRRCQRIDNQVSDLNLYVPKVSRRWKLLIAIMADAIQLPLESSGWSALLRTRPSYQYSIRIPDGKMDEETLYG